MSPDKSPIAYRQLLKRLDGDFKIGPTKLEIIKFLYKIKNKADKPLCY
jgi:hypothetical protein